MLYVTTRDKTETYTANHALNKDHGRDGGLYVPFRLPRFSNEEIRSLRDKTFSQCVAEVLNVFFSARLSGADVECLIGACPVRLESMSHKIVIGELWHNSERSFSRLVGALLCDLRGICHDECIASDWTWMAVRIAVLFGIFAQLQRDGLVSEQQCMDISVAADDFGAPMAAWYAREMGLPIGMIVCSCNDNSELWDLLHHGELNTALAARAGTAGAELRDLSGLERLIFEAFGLEENRRYLDICAERGIYTLNEQMLYRLRKGLFAAVISKARTESVMHSVYRTSGYSFDPCAALAFGGLQDFRASTNETGFALILAEHGPLGAAERTRRSDGN